MKRYIIWLIFWDGTINVILRAPIVMSELLKIQLANKAMTESRGPRSVKCHSNKSSFTGTAVKSGLVFLPVAQMPLGTHYISTLRCTYCTDMLPPDLVSRIRRRYLQHV